MDAALTLELFSSGFLGSFLSKSLKTNQLEVNTDEKTLRPIARLKEPRDLFALPKDSSHDCPQQAARWPTECQVLDERIYHIEYVPELPEPYYKPTGSELKPRPVGEENGIVVYNYNPVSAVNYTLKTKQNGADDSDGSDSDISSGESRNSSPERVGKLSNKTKKFTKFFSIRSSSNSDIGEDDEDDDDEDENAGQIINGKDNSNSRGTVEQLLNYHAPEEFQQPLVKCLIKRYDAQKVPEPQTLAQITPKPMSARLVENYLVNNHNNHNNSSAIHNNKKNCSLSFNNHHHDNNSDNEELDDTKNTIFLNDDENCNEIFLTNIHSTKLTNDGQTLTSTIKREFGYSLLQFSRSSVGGAKFLMNVHTSGINQDDVEYDGLEFESRFESGNLAKAVKITSTYYELYLRPDLYTNRHKQWFYFRVTKTKKNVLYRFSIVNLVKSDSLYNEGMRPLMYSSTNAKMLGEGWRRCGDNICYYKNDEDTSVDDDDENSSYTLTFNIQFSHDDDTVYFAHSYPYTYSDLQDYLMEIQKHPIKSKFCKLRLLCRSLAGNNVYYLTVTAPTADEESIKRKKAIIVSARVHPGETPSSWMMKGLMDFITGDTNVAKRLRHKFIFKLIPMLNPDGVIVGNTRSSLTGKDLNRQYRTVIRETYPSIWYTKAMIKRLIDECGVAMYCDMHAHSRAHNIFIYGCENKRVPDKKLLEQVFPLMVHKNVADKFSFESCKFKIQRSKEGTGRIVIWMLGILNSYTIEASFGGSSLGSRSGTHFSTADYEHMGRAFCETLLDYYDENPTKVKKRDRLFKRIKRTRKRERRERKAMKLKKLAEEGCILDENNLIIAEKTL